MKSLNNFNILLNLILNLQILKYYTLAFVREFLILYLVQWVLKDVLTITGSTNSRKSVPTRILRQFKMTLSKELAQPKDTGSPKGSWEITLRRFRGVLTIELPNWKRKNNFHLISY